MSEIFAIRNMGIQIFVDIFLSMCYIYITFKLARNIQRWLTLYQQSKKDTIYLYPQCFRMVELKNEFCHFKVYISFLAFLCVFLIFGQTEFYKFIMILFVILCITLLRSPYRNDILESCKLNIGYGAALCYYENYLKLFLPHNFLERIEEFKSYHKVPVQNKLFILIPKSCKVQRYLDTSELESIERCQELPNYEETVAGIKNRVYNITVYLVRNKNFPKGVRLPVEYAQPLKGFFVFKEKNRISVEEMFYQRRLFIDTLQDLLRDINHSYKYCELIDYDDDENKVSDVLLRIC